MKALLLTQILIFIFSLQIYTQSTQNRLLQTLTYVTTNQRGRTVTEQCKSTSRQKLYNNYNINSVIPHTDSVSKFFDLNTTIIDYALSDDWTKVGDQLKRNGGKLFVFVGAWVISLGIMLILVPFWLCCCICPWSCPLWNRKRQNMPYTQCELKWPAISAVIFLLIVFVVSIVGIASGYKAILNYQQFACSSGVVIDDVNNGNVSYFDTSTFFTGVRTLDTQLRDLNNKMVILNTQMSKLTSNSTGVKDANLKISNSKVATSQVPNTNQTNLLLSYNTPIQSQSPTSSVKSSFPNQLGNKSSFTSLVGKAYNSLINYEQKILVMSNSADKFMIDSTSWALFINNATKQTNKTATTIQNKDRQINDFFNKNQSTANGISVGQYVLYGLLIGFSFVTIFVIICTVWGKSESCRHLMYFLAFIIFLLALGSFLYCIVASIINPITYYSCQYIDQNLNSKTKLYDTLTKRLSIDSTSASNISECIAADGSGNIASNLLGSTVYDSLVNLNNSYLSLSDINFSVGSIITQTHLSLKDIVTSVKAAKKNDISDQNTLNTLKTISTPSKYQCDSPGFTQDSWIPSINQNPSYVTCKSNLGSNSDSNTCPNSLAFTSRSNGCTGCMDTYDLFKTNSSANDVKTSLNSRYSNPSCLSFNNQLSNIWNNFYKTKMDVISPVQSRAQKAETQSSIAVATIPYFEDVQKNIYNQFSNIVDTQYGILNGLDCKIIGEDVRLMRTVFCQNIFIYTYFVRVIFGIISLALLFALCCITFTGHRNCKQMDFRNQKMDNRNDNQDQKQKKIYNPNIPPSSDRLIQLNTNFSPPIDGNQYDQYQYYRNGNNYNDKNPYER